MAIATLFDLAIAVAIALRLRREREAAARAPADPTERPARFLVAVFAGALLIAALTTPALAATEAGIFATPHGSDANDGFDWGDLVHGH